MKTIRVLVPPGSLVDHATIVLDPAELHHLRVRRTADDADVEAIDGEGRSARGSLVAGQTPTAVAVGVVQAAPPAPGVVLAVGAGDKDRFLALAERCTELGVTRLIPLQTARSRNVDTRVRASSIERIRRRAREACKQSGNPWATVVDDVCDLADLRARYPDVRWVLADTDGATGLRAGAGEAVGWIVGPEGGLTADELEYCRSHLAATPISLGPHILRFDTAAVAAAAITYYRRAAPTEV